MKLCDYCKEEVQDEAVKCKHCQSKLLSPKMQKVKLKIQTMDAERKQQGDSLPVKVVYVIIAFMVGFLGMVWIQGLSLSNLIYNLFGIRL